jgi:hypothetical protein
MSTTESPPRVHMPQVRALSRRVQTGQSIGSDGDSRRTGARIAIVVSWMNKT